MKFISGVMAAAFIVLALGCSSGIKVQHDWDKQEDFSRFKTYDIMEMPQNKRGNQLVFKRIVDAVERELAAKGLTRNVPDPDLLVAIHTSVKNRVNVTDWGYHYAPYGYYWGGSGYWGGSRIDVYEYEEGTLIIDFVKAGDEEMIWRGVAQGTMPENPSPEKVDRIINEVVNRILKNYPPKPGK
ncbi:MAG: DUF4136 domain-containing protein [Calditrichia bacterium]